MKKTIMACACALLLSTGNVFAQMQPAPGASSEGNVGPGATKSMKKSTNMKKGMTTGTGKMMKSGSSSSAPSSQGNVGPGTNNNSGPQPGGR